MKKLYEVLSVACLLILVGSIIVLAAISLIYRDAILTEVDSNLTCKDERGVTFYIRDNPRDITVIQCSTGAVFVEMEGKKTLERPE